MRELRSSVWLDLRRLTAPGAAALLTSGVLALTAGTIASLGGTLTFSTALALGTTAWLSLVLAHYGSPQRRVRGTYTLPWTGVAVLLCAVLAGAGYALSAAEILAWVALLAGWSGLLFASDLLATRGFWRAILALCLIAAVGAIVPVAGIQIALSFAEEEFFVALQVVVLGVFVAGTVLGHWLLARYFPRSPSRGLAFQHRPVLLVLGLILFLAGCLTLESYQRSFYTFDVPVYSSITTTSPFLCGEIAADATEYDGVEVFTRLLARVEANPRKGTPEYGMLALATGAKHWAERFRTSILDEATAGAFTRPAHSVKYTQYEAAKRAYYYPRIVNAFPSLFSDEEQTQLLTWFASINERALTVEWVDLLYATAYAKWPGGPYENQENGAGLLALLESADLGGPDLQHANETYLLANPRGWNERFRNTDDALIYQLEWIENAYYQSLYQPVDGDALQRQSFEWLVLQALPDGNRLGYNHVNRPSLAGVAYLGAILLQDPRYVWLSGRALDALEQRGEVLPAQPGVESPVSLVGRSPTSGSCLLYGDSGLPNQLGPLAPDKVVLRNGWTEDSLYMLLNLRFSGWHRYKATNTLTLMYQDTALIGDVAAGQPFGWLPVGRSLFRDKRIPRENLNGLLVPRAGLDAVLHTLTGLGGHWAQDPPHYAWVADFQAGGDSTQTQVIIEDWHGWRHDRFVRFADGDDLPVLIVDDAQGPERQSGVFAWHVAGGEWVEDRRLRVHLGESTAELLWIPLGIPGEMLWERGEGGALTIHCTGQPGQLRWALLLLRGEWVGAEASFDAQTSTLRIGSLQIPLE